MGCQSTKSKKHPPFFYANPGLMNEYTISWSKKFTKSKTNFDTKQEKQIYCLEKNPILLRRQKQKPMSI
ncbi:unnamed protein product (macronuclear) [Paramecium tetraurelia]|uniref:Uncharacterized protein n=1 Tax=Paramecium tetraurelia TaxID=5888 RepID=A0E9P6_PARTE|nr:uncharacterized protein GSPATT00024744001 [Paramecium tetraurelia]CAK92013.1 unnamed protein product [Paramecium tetraurelia]|eukprot:XP_001459410.1 hypothetical protein (macronuclear) [Paramecium tetraurelia strain d4-2]